MSKESPAVTASIIIRSAPADVFAAFNDADKMSQFWFTRRDAGLIEGENSTWYLGKGEDAYAFDVRVKTVIEPETLVIEWQGPEGHWTEVRWSFADSGDGNTVLTIVETGFRGSDEEISASARDSKGGFNQVIVAAKALVEHGVALNVVDDHA